MRFLSLGGGYALVRSRSRTTGGIEIVVRLENDATIAVIQGRDLLFSPGDRVQVLHGRDGSTRVQPP